MRRGTVITLGASAVFGVLAIFMARGFIDKAVSVQYAQSKASQKPPRKAIQTTPVLVSTLDLNVGDRLLPQHLRLVDYPLNAVPLGSYTDFDLLFTNPEKPPVVLVKMTENEPVLEYKVSGPGGFATLSARIGDGMRAVSIRITDVSGVSGFVKPGDAVDIMLTQEVDKNGKPAARQRGSVGAEEYKAIFTTHLLVQNVRVLGAGAQTDIQSGGAAKTKTLTLEVSHEQAQKLALAGSVGSLSLALRSIGSEEILIPSTLTMSGLKTSLPQKTRSANRKSSNKPQPTNDTVSVTVIRNGKRDQVNVFQENEEEPQMAGGSL